MKCGWASVWRENLYGVNVLTLGGDKKRPDMRSGSGVDINMLSFNRSCYLRTIHLVNRSMSTPARSLNIGQFKNNGLSQHSQCIFLFKSGLFDFSFSEYKNENWNTRLDRNDKRPVFFVFFHILRPGVVIYRSAKCWTASVPDGVALAQD